MVSIKKNVSTYYTQKLEEYGDTPRGVDWNDEQSQKLRFKLLTESLLYTESKFSICDYGSGMGHLATYLQDINYDFSYHGFDISESMVETASKKFTQNQHITFSTKLEDERKFDFTIASGIFNVKLGHTDEEWWNYILETIRHFDQLSIRGFAFNCLTNFSDPDKMRHDLYYANATDLFNFCMKRYGKKVSLLHDYPLYEFTILVRKLS